MLPVTFSKGVYKKILLENGGEALNQRLTDLLLNCQRYAERLDQVTHLADKLEWALQAQIDTALESWFISQGERHFGFRLVKDEYGLNKMQNSGYQWHPLPEKAKNKSDKSGFSSVDFIGELEITDVEKFKNALFEGIGRAKGYGCGLLLIRRI